MYLTEVRVVFFSFWSFGVACNLGFVLCGYIYIYIYVLSSKFLFNFFFEQSFFLINYITLSKVHA